MERAQDFPYLDNVYIHLPSITYSSTKGISWTEKHLVAEGRFLYGI